MDTITASDIEAITPEQIESVLLWTLYRLSDAKGMEEVRYTANEALDMLVPHGASRIPEEPALKVPEDEENGYLLGCQCYGCCEDRERAAAT
jgi:hypothetical protein